MNFYDKRFITIFVIQITEVLGFSLILPFLPYYASNLGASPFKVSLILSTFSLFQFFSAPIMGRLSDSYGRRPLLIISQLSTFISFLVLGFSNSLFWIFTSRIIDGLLGSNFSIAQAYLSDISAEEDRSKVFGYSGVAFGLGFLVGPAIGGFLSQFGYSVPSFLAAFISLVTILITWFFLPETIEKQREFKLQVSDIFKLKEFKKFLFDSEASCTLWQYFTYNLAHVIWVSNFALFAQAKVGANAQNIGWLLAYIGLISIIFRGFLLQKLLKFVSEEKLRFLGILSLMLGLLSAAFINKFWQLPIVMAFFSMGTGLTRPLIMGAISKTEASRYQGSLMGVASSLGSLAQIIGPLIGGYLLNNYASYSVSLAAFFVISVGLFLFLMSCRALKRIRINL